MIRYLFKRVFVFFKTIIFIFFNFNKIRFVGLPIILKQRGSKFHFGNNIVINSGNYSNLIGTNRSIIVVNKKAVLSIGDNTGLSGVSIYCKKEIKIGENVKIGSNTKIFDTDFHPLDFETRRLKNNGFLTVDKPVEICDDVFIGEGVLILKGSKIGSRSIIGAKSVISGIVPPDTIAYGNPFKIKKMK